MNLKTIVKVLKIGTKFSTTSDFIFSSLFLLFYFFNFCDVVPLASIPRGGLAIIIYVARLLEWV
jgi:hypothetical protein